MKILFLTYCYPPQRFPRSVQISHLVGYLRQDYDVQVICAPPENNLDESLLNFTSLDNVIIADKSTITRAIENVKGYKYKKMLFPDQEYFWHFDLFKTAVKVIAQNEVDLIVTFGQPMSTHIAGLKLKEKFPHLKWLAHFSDPWVDNPFNQYNKWTKYINTYYQNKVFTISDALIFTSRETIDLIKRNSVHLDVNKCQLLAHCFDESLFVANERVNDSLIVRYIGNFYGNRQPAPLFKALQLIRDKTNGLKIELVGADNNIVNEITKYNLQDIVTIIPAVNYVKSLEYATSSDLLLVIDAPNENSPFFPSKLVDYIGAAKPIFGITPDGAAKEIIEEMGFLVANPDNPSEIADKFLQMITRIHTKTKINILSEFRNKYKVSFVGQQMAKLIDIVRG